MKNEVKRDEERGKVPGKKDEVKKYEGRSAWREGLRRKEREMGHVKKKQG